MAFPRTPTVTELAGIQCAADASGKGLSPTDYWALVYADVANNGEPELAVFNRAVASYVEQYHVA